MSQDGNLKSRLGETDWNIQSYLFDTRVSCVEIFQVGVLQETFFFCPHWRRRDTYNQAGLE